MFKKVFKCNFCDQWSIKFSLKSFFYQIPLTWSKIYNRCYELIILIFILCLVSSLCTIKGEAIKVIIKGIRTKITTRNFVLFSNIIFIHIICTDMHILKHTFIFAAQLAIFTILISAVPMFYAHV